MSSSQYTYIGPYLEVPHAEQEKPEPPISACEANAKHRVRSDMKFCPECGAPVVTTRNTATKMAPIDVYDICEEAGINEIVWQPASERERVEDAGTGMWLSNTRGMGRELGEDEVICLSDMEPHAFAKEMSAFSGLLAPTIAAIREKFGVEAVVKYGIISYYH